MLFPSTVAGSLPKPSWLAEPNKLWPQWRLSGDELAQGKLDATLLAVKLQEDAGIDIVCDGEMSRQHFVHGFLEFVDGIDFAHKVEMGIRADRYKAMVPVVRGALTLKGRVHQAEARHARAHTQRKLKITLPGPMTISDTIADAHYGDKVKMAMAFADLLNQEARALQADGVDVIQFDEPAFNVFMDEVPGWGIEALHRAIDGLTCTTAVHICYGYGIKANIDWKNSLGGEWTQYEKIFPALAKSRIKQVSLEAINSRVPLKTVVAARRQGRAGRRHRRRHRRGRDAGAGRRRDRRCDEVRAEGAHRRLHQLRHGADAARHRRGQAQGARRGREAGARRNSASALARPARPITSISSSTLRRWSALSPLEIACCDAMRDVVAQDFLLDAAQRGAHRADLRDDVDAVALVLDHAGEAAHLALDAFEPSERWCLAVLGHAAYIPPGGIEDKSRRIPPSQSAKVAP